MERQISLIWYTRLECIPPISERSFRKSRRSYFVLIKCDCLRRALKRVQRRAVVSAERTLSSPNPPSHDRSNVFIALFIHNCIISIRRSIVLPFGGTNAVYFDFYMHIDLAALAGMG